MEKFVRLSAATVLALATQGAIADDHAFITASAGAARYSGHGGVVTEISSDGSVTTAHRDNKDLAFAITGGYRWELEDRFSLGPELGYVNLGSVKSHGSGTFATTGFQTYKINVKSQAALVGANAKWDLGYNWIFGLRTGFLHSFSTLHTSAEITYDQFSAQPGRYKENAHGNGYYGALSIGYDFTPSFGTSVSYEHYHTHDKFDYETLSQNTGVWSVSAEYRF